MLVVHLLIQILLITSYKQTSIISNRNFLCLFYTSFHYLYLVEKGEFKLFFYGKIKNVQPDFGTFHQKIVAKYLTILLFRSFLNT